MSSVRLFQPRLVSSLGTAEETMLKMAPFVNCSSGKYTAKPSAFFGQLRHKISSPAEPLKTSHIQIFQWSNFWLPASSYSPGVCLNLMFLGSAQTSPPSAEECENSFIVTNFGQIPVSTVQVRHFRGCKHMKNTFLAEGAAYEDNICEKIFRMTLKQKVYCLFVCFFGFTIL